MTDAGGTAEREAEPDGTTERGGTRTETFDERGRQLLAFAQREFDTVVRTRSYAALALVYTLLVVALPVSRGVGGYLPLVLDLLAPVEVFVPVLAFGFGAWTVLADAHRGELDVIRTYPVDRWTYVVGVYLGRAVALLAVVLLPLVLVGLAVPLLREPATSVLASHGTVDSPTYLGRFVVLAGTYGVVTLAIAMAVSSLARSRRSGIAAAVLGLLLVVVGLDTLVVLGLGQGVLGADTLGFALGLSPTSAFRGLVLETAVSGLVDVGPPAANAVASVFGLSAWFLVGLGVAVLTAWRADGR